MFVNTSDIVKFAGWRLRFFSLFVEEVFHIKILCFCAVIFLVFVISYPIYNTFEFGLLISSNHLEETYH
jgi:hypothetical protein